MRPIGTAANAITEALADAEQLARHYDYDVDRLRYEWQRRCAGSFTTTLAGSPRERDRYQRAWELALARRPNRAPAPEPKPAYRFRCEIVDIATGLILERDWVSLPSPRSISEAGACEAVDATVGAMLRRFRRDIRPAG